MLAEPSFCLRALRSHIGFVSFAKGALVMVWPGHPTHTATVLRADGLRVVRHYAVSDGALYWQIVTLDADGVLTFLTLADQRAMQRQLRAS